MSGVHAYVLVQTEIGRSAAVAHAIIGLPGVTAAEEVTGPYDVIASRRRHHRSAWPRSDHPHPARPGHHPHANLQRGGLWADPRATLHLMNRRSGHQHRPRAAAVAAGLCALTVLTGCGAPVAVTPPNPIPTMCDDLARELPKRVEGKTRRTTTPVSAARRLGRPADGVALWCAHPDHLHRHCIVA